jgi:hypothetical protein
MAPPINWDDVSRFRLVSPDSNSIALSCELITIDSLIENGFKMNLFSGGISRPSQLLGLQRHDQKVRCLSSGEILAVVGEQTK